MKRSNTFKVLRELDAAYLNSRTKSLARNAVRRSKELESKKLPLKRPHKGTLKYQEYIDAVKKGKRPKPHVIANDEDKSHSEETTPVKRQRKPVVHYQADSPKVQKKKLKIFKMNYEAAERASTNLIEKIDRYLSTGGRVEEQATKTKGSSSEDKDQISDKIPTDRPNKCNFCRGCGADGHEEDDCTEFPTVGTRTFVFNRFKLCKNCLGKDICRKNCKVIPCKYCGKEEHHKALCPDKHAKLNVDHDRHAKWARDYKKKGMTSFLAWK